MVSGAPAQGRHVSSTGSSMWAVVVLGIITAVFAWVWFGGRGDQKGSETREEAEQTSANAKTEIGSKTGTERSDEFTSKHPRTQEHEKSAGDGGPNTTGEESKENLSEIASPLYKEEKQGIADPISDESIQLEDQTSPIDQKPFIVKDREEDVYQISVPRKEVQQITEVVLEPPHLAKEELAKTSSTILQNGEIHEDLGPSGVTHEELLTREQVEHLKPSILIEENLEATSKGTSHPIPDTATNSVHPAQDDVKLVNGIEELVLEDKATVCSQHSLSNDYEINDTVSAEEVNRSTRENNIEQCDHTKLESYVQSESAFSEDKTPSATLASADTAQVNGHITQENNPSADKCYDLLNASNQKDESLDLRGSTPDDHVYIPSPPDAKVYDVDTQRTKRVAAVQPIPHNVSLEFKVHYITQSNSQVIGVTGDHEKLGEWENYIPLTRDKDGYWSHSLTLPADANIEWKFVLVENGKIKRWEECSNRHLRTAHEDIAAKQWWGYP